MRVSSNESGINAVGCLDRLPIGSIHRKALTILAFIYFFQFAVLNMTSTISPVLKAAWSLTTSDFKWITGITYAGMFIGPIIGGWVANRYGRKRAVIVTTLIFSIFSILTALSWNLFSFGLFRFVTGMAVSSALVNFSTYISEFFPAASRGKIQCIALVVGMSGVPATPLIARSLIAFGPDGWRYVFLWGGMGLIGLLFSRSLYEVPRWYISRGEHRKAEEIAREIVECTYREKGEVPPKFDVASPTQSKTRTLAEAQVPAGEGVWGGRHLHSTVVLGLSWIFQSVALHGFTIWAPWLLEGNGVTVDQKLMLTFLFSLGAPAGALIAAFVSDRFERKWNLIVTSVVLAALVLCYGMTAYPAMLVALGFLVNLIERTNISNLYTYTSELYPTHLRSTGYGITYGLGKLSSTFSPILIGSLFVDFGAMAVWTFLSLCWVVLTIALSFGPKTNKRSLDEVGTDMGKAAGGGIQPSTRHG